MKLRATCLAFLVCNLLNIASAPPRTYAQRPSSSARSVPADATPAVAVPSTGAPAGMEKKKVKMPDGTIRELSLPPGAKLPPGAEFVEDEAKPGENEGKSEDKEGEDTNKPVKRGDKPPEPPDPKELAIRPDEEGMIAFQFRNQSWPDLLKWLAEISNMSLDWQELPGDYVNIANQHRFTIEQTRDLFNGHLLARGYTMLEKNGILQVVKTEKINLALVPIVDAAALRDLPGNRFVRTSFKLSTLLVDNIVEELQPLKSPNGQLIGLTATNRLEAVDSVSNLIAIKHILDSEQSDEAIDQLAREFELVHIRADEAKEQLEVFLGLKKPSSSSGEMGDPQMNMQMQQMQRQMQQMQQQGGGAPGGKPAAEEEKVYLVANTRMNSIIAHAPPNKLAVIAAFVHRIDVPGDSALSLDMLQSRMRTYRLASLDPERLVNSLRNMDALEPKTRIEVDTKNKAIMVFASIADHMLIDQVVKRLDGSAREFDVIPLRRLIAEDVAGTINMMMGTEEEEDEQQNRYSYFYYNPRGNSEEKSKDKFRVTANAYDNQLLIWANEIEREEVNKLLVKLGEILPDGGSGGPFRTIDAARSPETYEYLQRIKEQWAKISDTPLELPNRDLFESSDDSRPPSASSKESDQEEDTPQSEKDDESSDVAPDVAPEVAPEVEEGQPKPIADTENKITATGNISFVADQEGIPRGRLLQTQTSLTTESRPDRSTSVAAVSSENAIRIGLDARGNLILYSEDTEALNALESLMLDIAPPARPYQVIHVQHQTATWITFDLEDYFKDLETDESNQDPREAYYRYIFDLDSGQSKKKPAQLGRKRPLRFIPNNDTQTILVIGADDETLEVIERLVALWDVPDKVDDSRVRYTQIVAIKYSRAELIVETMKEAFRDLLSSNDKAFEKKNDRGGGESGESAGDTSSVTSEGGMNFSFSGRLSFGVDKVTNSILVSCEKQLLELLVSTIERLDEAAKPSANIEVHEVELGGNESLKKALQAILGQRERNPAVPDPNAQPGQNNPNGQLQNNVLPMNNNGGRGSSRRE